MTLVYVGFFEEKLDMSTSVDIRGLLEKQFALTFKDNVKEQATRVVAKQVGIS